MEKGSGKGGFTHVFEKITDLVLLNVVMLLFCLPLICLILVLGAFFPLNALTVIISCLSVLTGAAFTALHHCLTHLLHDEEGYTIPDFFRAYRGHFRQATLLWLLTLLICFVLFWDLGIAETITSFWGMLFSFVCYAALFALALTALYLPPWQARSENTLAITVKCAFLTAVYALPKSLLMLLIHAAVFCLLFFLTTFVMPLYLILGISGPAYLCTLLYDPVLKQFEKE